MRDLAFNPNRVESWQALAALHQDSFRWAGSGLTYVMMYCTSTIVLIQWIYELTATLSRWQMDVGGRCEHRAHTMAQEPFPGGTAHAVLQQGHRQYVDLLRLRQRSREAR